MLNNGRPKQNVIRLLWSQLFVSTKGTFLWRQTIPPHPGVTRMDGTRNVSVGGAAAAHARWLGHVQMRGSEYIGRGMLRLELEEEQGGGEWMRWKRTWSYLLWENRARWRQVIGCGRPWRKRSKDHPSHLTPPYNHILKAMDGIITIYKPLQQAEGLAHGRISEHVDTRMISQKNCPDPNPNVLCFLHYKTLSTLFESLRFQASSAAVAW